MSDPDTGIPVREPAATSVDDTILPFAVDALDLRGRVVRLGPLVDTILRSHAYPTPVARLLGEAIVLAVMLGSVLKFEGRFILQTQTDGPVRMLVVDFRTPGSVRGCARFDKERVAAAMAAKDDAPGALLGRGHLAMTIDQGPDMSRYQGLVALEGKDLEHAAHEYFLRSEQIPTRVRIAVGEEIIVGAEGTSQHWRAGGVVLQFLPRDPKRAQQADFDPGDAPEGIEPHSLPEDDAWREGRSLVSTVQDDELIDPTVSSERLLYRLFHQRGVRVFRSRNLAAECSCSRAGVATMLGNFSQDDRDHMVENGVITVTCEFCSATYVFKPQDVASSQDVASNDAEGRAGEHAHGRES